MNDITNENTCQEVCQHIGACQYFVYDTKPRDCALYDSGDKDCDVMGGPPTPNYDEACK